VLDARPELDGEALRKLFRERDGNHSARGGLEVSTALPLDQLEIPLDQFKPTREVADLVSGEVIQVQNILARLEVVVGPRSLPRPEPCRRAGGNLGSLLRIRDWLAILVQNQAATVVGEDRALPGRLRATDSFEVIEDTPHLTPHHPIDLTHRLGLGG
jgi:hypothetical protein